MSDFFSLNLPYLLGGISVGGQYALIAIGYTMVYGILRLINFAHGDIFTVAGFVMVYLSATLPLLLDRKTPGAGEVGAGQRLDHQRREQDVIDDLFEAVPELIKAL